MDLVISVISVKNAHRTMQGISDQNYVDVDVFCTGKCITFICDIVFSVLEIVYF